MQTCIEIPEELFAPAESSSFSGVYSLAELDAHPDTYTFAAPINWSITVYSTGDALVVNGSVEAQGKTACARCLDEFALDIEGTIEGYYVLPGKSAPEDMDEDEYDFLGEDHIIDVAPLIEAAILVDIPLVPLCDEACKGICPDCGANLNEETCSCAQQREVARAAEAEASNPFAVLKQIAWDETSKDDQA